MAHYFPYDLKLRLLAHSRSFLANQKARNSIGGAENFINNIILTSLHLLSFSWNPSAFVFSVSSSTFNCKVLLPFLITDSESVMSSTYFQRTDLDTDRSLIIMR